MSPLFGPVLGPVIWGFLSQAKGWRRAFWLQTVVSRTSLLLGLVFLRETYAVVILEQKTKKIIRETRNQNLISALHDGTSKERFSSEPSSVSRVLPLNV